jgi:hypothetical protein
MAKLLPQDARRAALSAGLLASNHDGEVIAAARALVCLLKKADLDPAGVIAAGLSGKPTEPMPERLPSGYPRPWRERAAMARSSPHVNEWERQFLKDMIDRRSLSPRQESLLKDILRKSKGPGQ